MRVWAVNSTNWAPAGRQRIEMAVAPVCMLLIQFDNAFAFGRLVGDRGHGRELAEIDGGVVAHGHKLRGPAIADGDGAGLVQEQSIDVAGHFDGLAALGNEVGPQGPIHAGDADGRQQGADGGRNQATSKATSVGISVPRLLTGAWCRSPSCTARHSGHRPSGRDDQEDERKADSTSDRAISFGVRWRMAPSTRRSRWIEERLPGAAP